MSDMLEKTPHVPDILLDAYNIITLDNVRPAKWIDPTPTGKYNMIAIGSGAGGLVASIGASTTGGKSAIIERHFMGGDCLNTGCVPSKALIKCAHQYAAVKNADKFGIEVSGVTLNFGKVMERMRRVRAEISYHDSVKKLTD
jgi:pyruvate/2-oxoglutarate dehydrogenase complex dihydrolipoamide dehydrogenase (E3) component